jgi:hypothetical protein
VISPLLLDQLAARHRSDLLAELHRAGRRLPPPSRSRASRLRRIVLDAGRALGDARTRSSSRTGQLCCA